MIALLAAGALAAGWPPVDPDRAVPIVNGVFTAVDTTAACSAVATDLRRYVDDNLDALVDAGTAVEAVKPSPDLRIATVEGAFHRLDTRCIDDEAFARARRYTIALGFPPIQVELARLPPPGRNVQACRGWVEHFNALPCAAVAALPVDRTCPRTLDDVPIDMSAFYGCMKTELRCRGAVIDAGDPSRCSETLTPGP